MIPKYTTKHAKLRRLRALFTKEFYQIIRDPSSLLVSVVLPMILLFLYGFGVSLDMDHLRVGLVLEDTAPDAISFADSMKNSPYFEVEVARDRRYFDRKIATGAIRGIIIVPSYFSSFRKRPNTIAPIYVIADGSEPNTANFVQNYARGAFASWLQQEAISNNLSGLPLVTIESRFWYNEQLESRNFLVPGSLALIMTLIGTLLTALVVSREWERGTMEALMSTPVTIGELVIGKLIPYFVLGMVSMTICVLITTFLYQVPFRGSYFALALTTSVFLIGALGTGLLISTIVKTQFTAAQIAQVVSFLPAVVLSGFIFEIRSMPLYIQWMTYLLPARYLVSSLQTLFLVGDIWKLLAINNAAMAALGGAVLLLTIRKTVKRLD